LDRIRILIADEQPGYRSRLRSALQRSNRIELVAEAGSAQEALSVVGSLGPDVVLLDTHLPGANGLSLTRAIKQSHPTASVLSLTAAPDEEELFDAIRYGAAAYVPKSISDVELVDIIVRVRNGRYVIDDHVLANPALASRVLHAFRDLAAMDQQVKPLFAPLSAREIEVLEHAARGSSNKIIARAMGISDQTVKNHLTSIMRKLAVNDRTHAVVYALQQGWIKMENL
jgi:DNA-binding NarL/FixJ family response regulator